jgi:hypothetical protein
MQDIAPHRTFKRNPTPLRDIPRRAFLSRSVAIMPVLRHGSRPSKKAWVKNELQDDGGLEPRKLHGRRSPVLNRHRDVKCSVMPQIECGQGTILECRFC